jgi:hypothetical protein
MRFLLCNWLKEGCKGKKKVRKENMKTKERRRDGEINKEGEERKKVGERTKKRRGKK